MLKMISSVPFDESLKVSAKEFGESLGVEYPIANGFLKFLEAKGIATVEPLKVEGKKGKPTNIYTIPICIQLTVHEEKSTEVKVA